MRFSMNVMLSDWSIAMLPLDNGTARCSKSSWYCPVRLMASSISCITPGMHAGLPSYEIGSVYLSQKIGQSEVLVGLSVVGCVSILMDEVVLGSVDP